MNIIALLICGAELPVVLHTCACSELRLFGNAHLLHQHAACHCCDSCDSNP